MLIILERVRLNNLLSTPDNLPSPKDFDTAHRQWRQEIIEVAQEYGLAFTHGVAAKLINIYFKAAFVCGGYYNHTNVQAIHPPIDRKLLDELSKKDVGGLHQVWNVAKRIGWSKFNSDQYETVIQSIRDAIQDNEPLWVVEQYWQGYQ